MPIIWVKYYPPPRLLVNKYAHTSTPLIRKKPSTLRSLCLQVRQQPLPSSVPACRRLRRTSSLDYGGKHVVSRQWPSDPFQLELTDWLDPHGVLDLCQYSRADEDLTRLGFIAKPRGNVGYRPDGGVVETSLEADGAQRGEAVRYTDAEANVVSPNDARFRSAFQ